MPPPEVVVLDVNETLSDLAPIADRFATVGAPRSLLPTWFAGVLRDGMAATLAGGYAEFRELALAGLAALLPRESLARGVDEAAEYVVDGFSELDVHPDVPGGLGLLQEAGVTVVTLTNGSVGVTEALLGRAGLLDLVDHRLDVSTPGRWKPAPEAYRHALDVCGVEAARTALVAVHPWDVMGAMRAGLTGGWLARDGGPWPEPFGAPDVQARDLPTLVGHLLSLDSTG